MQRPQHPYAADGAPAATLPPLRILVTAGPTEEPIDEVRFVGNRSSGQLGIAVAEAFADAGTEVVLALGPVRSALPVRRPQAGAAAIRVERFRTAADLRAIMALELPEADVVVMAAAVADFRPAVREGGKLRRGEARTLELEPVEDLLSATRGARKRGACIIGFALEPREELERSARGKLERKDLAAIVANPLETMDAPDIDATLYLRDGGTRRMSPPGTRVAKTEFARWLAAEALSMRA
jgi:phosphopantothenoylcysteine decarboxylase/phosphopantothenate--cysteine ligase